MFHTNVSLFLVLQEVPAPIGRVNQGTNLPADLTRALYSLQQSWPRYTPSRLNTEAFLQLALGDVAAAQATLDTAAQKMISASIPWYDTTEMNFYTLLYNLFICTLLHVKVFAPVF